MKIDYYFTGLFLLTAFLLLISVYAVKAQSGYSLVGTTRQNPSSDCYQLTQEIPGKPQVGAIWCDRILHLSESFKLEFTVNFGANALGADGLVIVMQTEGSTVLGEGGSGIGFQGLNRSFGIEFDTHTNGNLGDPNSDHMALIRDGSTNHRLNSTFAPPVPISITSATVKDGRDHLIKIEWNVYTHTIKVYADCVLRITQHIDIANDIFGGIQEVNWGLTSATVSAGNAHTACLPKDIVVRDTIRVCQTENITLVAGLSNNNPYEWKPSTGLSNPYVRNPHLTATTNQLYTVRFVDRCSLLRVDSVFVNVKTPGLSIGEDRKVCEGETVQLNPVLVPSDSKVRFKWSTGDTTRQLNPITSGLYFLQIAAGGCLASDSVTVTFQPLPKLALSTEPVYDCPREKSILLNPHATGTGLQYAWLPTGSSDSTLVVNLPGIYTVKVMTDFGCTVETNFEVLDNCPTQETIFVPDIFTPNDDGLNEKFEWKSNADVEVRMKIYDGWGEIIFSSEAPYEFWDGTFQGIKCPSNKIYTWRLDYHFIKNNTNHWFVKYGNVLLLR